MLPAIESWAPAISGQRPASPPCQPSAISAPQRSPRESFFFVPFVFFVALRILRALRVLKIELCAHLQQSLMNRFPGTTRLASTVPNDFLVGRHDMLKARYRQALTRRNLLKAGT